MTAVPPPLTLVTRGDLTGTEIRGEAGGSEAGLELTTANDGALLPLAVVFLGFAYDHIH